MRTKGRTARIQIFNDDPQVQRKLFQALSNGDEQVQAQASAVFNKSMQDYDQLMIDSSRGVVQPDVELSQADQFPTQQGRVVQVFFESAEEPVDTTWNQLFTVDDFRGTNEDSLEMDTVRNAVSFRAYENGEEVELYGISGQEQKFKFQLVGGGFQWLQTWLDDNKWWRLPQGTAEAATQYAKEQAENAFDVLTASGITTETRVTTPTGLAQVAYDVLTINNAYVNILSTMRQNSGYGGADPTMYLVYNSLDAALAAERIPAILAANYDNAHPDLGRVQLNSNIQPLGSPNVPAGSLYLVLPGRKNRAGIRMSMTGFDQFDIRKYAGARVFWGRYVFVRGDSDQVRAIPLS